MRLGKLARLALTAAAALALALSGSAAATVSGVTIDQATLSSGRTMVVASGTFTCIDGDAFVSAQVIQDKTQGSGFAFLGGGCDGAAHSYSVTMSGAGGTFHSGRASVQVSVCNNTGNCVTTDARVAIHSA